LRTILYRLQYSTEGKLKEPNFLADAGKGLLQTITSYSKGDVASAMRSAIGLVKTATKKSKAEKISKATKTSPADCVGFVLVYTPPLFDPRPHRSHSAVAKITRPVLMRKKMANQLGR